MGTGKRPITNEEVRPHLEDIPNINFFINGRMWTYSTSEKLTTKSLKKHFLMTLKTVLLPELSEEGIFQEWVGLMTDEGTKEEIFDPYFQKIQKNNEESEADDDTAKAKRW